MAQAIKDVNSVATLIGVSNVDFSTPVTVAVDPVTHRVLTNVASGITSINGDSTAAQVIAAGTGISVATVSGTTTITNTGGSGTVTSVTSADGNATVATTTTTPVITIVSAPKLQTARTIAGVSFDGTANIAIPASGLSNGVTGSGAVVLVTSPTLITPTLGAASATSINGLTITSSTGTLTITNAKTLSISNSITLAGTDSTTMTFPSTSATIARTDAAQTFTGTQTFTQVLTTSNAITASSNAATIPITSKINTVTNNSAATLTITLTTTSATDGQLVIVRILDATGVAQTITWVNTENSTITAPTTSNGSTTLPLTVGFQFNSNTTKWRCIAFS